MSEEIAEQLLQEWKDRLGLSDWTTVLEWSCLPSDMVMTDVAGETEWQESNKVATIRILRETCYGDRVIPFDFEKTLIHELLHLKLSLLGESGNNLQDRLVHQIIDDLARAFVDARRKEDSA